MNRALASRLAALSPLSRTNAVSSAFPCKICGGAAPFFDITDFNKCTGYYAFGPSGISLDWHRCDRCGFLFTPFFDDWNEHDFRQFVYNDDYAKVDPDYLSARPAGTADRLAGVLRDFTGARILDYGSGANIFAARMRELGFANVESYDPFSMPQRPVGLFDLITCVEVIEHSPQPLQTLGEMRALLRDPGCILIGESLQPPDIDHIRCAWWYCAPRNGHVSLFADRSFATAAERLGLLFHRSSGGLHVMRTPGEGPLATLAASQGVPFSHCVLSAPSAASAPGFSGIEGAAGERFRWTTAQTIRWRISIAPGPPRTVEAFLPIAHQSRAGFAEACQIELADQRKPVARRGWFALVAEFDGVQPGDTEVILHTPPTLTSGDRSLGIAVRML